jgi:hypothetical protein
MAQRVNVVLVDDLDGQEASETVAFAVDGAQYEIDLSADNADKLREALAPYIAHARRANSSSGRRRSSGGGRSSGGRSGSGSSSGGASAAEIRTWAREHGHQVPERGRVSAEVREAYDAAH